MSTSQDRNPKPTRRREIIPASRQRGVVRPGGHGVRGLGLRVAVCVCLLVLAGGVGSAGASVTQFGGVGTGAGQFEEPHGIAVDQSEGFVYVLDRNNARVDKFATSGVFLAAWGWGVADGAEELQTCVATCDAGIQGAHGGQFEFPEGIAVDNDPLSASYHDVYVTDTRNNRVEKFGSNGEFILTFGGGVNETTGANLCVAGEACGRGREGGEPGEFSEPVSIAVGPSGDVYVGDVGRVEVFSQAGVYQESLPLGGAGKITMVGVDGGGDIYVHGRNTAGVQGYSAAHEQLVSVDEAGQPQTVAASLAGSFYVDDHPDEPGHRILAFAPGGVQVSAFDFATSEGGQRGIALFEPASELYVLSRHAVFVVASPPPGPLVVEHSEAASEVLAASASVGGLVDPEGAETEVFIEYGSTAAYGSTSAPVAVGEGFEPRAASVHVSNLAPSTEYHFRVVAKNAAGTSVGEDQTYVTKPPVEILSTFASGVSGQSARLHAEVNPLETVSSFHFDFGSTASYGQSTPQEVLGGGLEALDVAAEVDHLPEDTTIHYRVVVENGLGVSYGPDAVLRTRAGGRPALAEGRTWERVSANEKTAAIEPPEPEGGVIQASADGSRFTYIARGATEPSPPGDPNFLWSQIFASRSSSGAWSSRDIASPQANPVIEFSTSKVTEYDAFSEDLSRAALEPFGGTPLAPLPATAEQTLYLHATITNEDDPLVTAGDVPPGSEVKGSTQYVAATADFQHVVVDSKLALDPAHPGVNGLFEWSAASGFRLVHLSPEDQPVSTSTLGRHSADVRGAISEDGSRLVWEGDQHLYLRDMAVGETVQLDVPETASPGESHPVFQLADRGGKRVFFEDDKRLTSDSHAAPEAPDLYVFEVTSAVGEPLHGALRDLSAQTLEGEPADVIGEDIPGASRDGSDVYFIARGVLTGEANSEGAHPVGGQPNLYVRVRTEGGWAAPKFIASLDETNDHSDWYVGPGPGDLTGLRAAVSGNGMYLAFMSSRSLTGYDNVDLVSHARDQEVYLYSLKSGALSCVSCDPSGARPVGAYEREVLPGPLVDRVRGLGRQTLAGSLPNWVPYELEHAQYQSRFLGDDGRVFFDSPVALVEGDTNNTQDVYEYTPAGVGGCARPAGCVSLISSGTDDSESAFLDASASGEDVFFLTAAGLVPRDTNGAYDVYDAHVCSSGRPCYVEAAPGSNACEGAADCRGVPAQAPLTLAPLSSTAPLENGNVRPVPNAAVVRRAAPKPRKGCRALKSRVRRRRCLARRGNVKTGRALRRATRSVRSGR